jgi:hypothetical protein
VIGWLLIAIVVVNTSFSRIVFSWPHRRAFIPSSSTGHHGNLIAESLLSLATTRWRAGEVDFKATLPPKVPHVEYPKAACCEGYNESAIPTNTTTLRRNVTKALILMDSFCEYHGMYLAERARQVYGVAIVSVLSDYMTGYFLQQQQQQEQQQHQSQGSSDFQEDLLSRAMPSSLEEAKAWMQQLQESHGINEIVAIVCESDPGLANAEQLGEWLNVTHQNVGPHGPVNEARRNKYLMMETLHAAGIPVVQQRLCQTEEEAIEFAQQLGVVTNESSATATATASPAWASGIKVVVKPVRYV